MPLSRRQFLRNIVVAGAFAGGVIGIEAGRKAHDYFAQQETWDEASLPNDAFFERHADRLARLTLGGSFAPEEWFYDRPPTPEIMQAFDLAVRELGLRRMRMGIRWSRADRNGTPPELESWHPLLDYAFMNRVEVCLNLGPIRTFRFPEEQPPGRLLNNPAAIPPVGRPSPTRRPHGAGGPDLPRPRHGQAALPVRLGVVERAYDPVGK